jgi:DsbC/DsbD-like thiol-disulfide interchange protein
VARTSLLRNIVLLLAGLGAALPATAVPAHINVDLVSEYKAVTPARMAWIGLRFEIEPGWHIYWKDPGDSGQPPSIQWNLPAGLRAGSIRWPTPERIPDHTLVDFGYRHDVLLIAPLHVSRTVPVGHQVRLAATINYLVCKDICIPGSAHDVISLPVSRSRLLQPSEWHGLFLQTRARWPKPAPAMWKATALATAHQFVLTLHTGSKERHGVFFPADPSVIRNAAPQTVTPLADGVRINLQKSDLLVKTPARLSGVIVLDGDKAFLVDAPILSGTRRGG